MPGECNVTMRAQLREVGTLPPGRSAKPSLLHT